MPECQRIRNSLGRYFDGELSNTEGCLVEEHLKHCSQCSEELQQIHEIAGAFQEGMPVPPVPPNLIVRIMGEARAQIDGGLPGWSFLLFWRNWSFSMRLAALGVAAVACYVGLVISSGSLPSTRPAGAEMRWIGMTSQEPIVKAYLGRTR
jgi:anti-sigma factor RsiW